MSLTLYYHPLASFCWKVLIALYENDTPFERVIVDLGNDTSRNAFLKIWPMGKFPVIRDSAHDLVLPESAIAIEYLDTHFPGRTTFIPRNNDLARRVRLLDQLLDRYVHEPMQKMVADRIRPEGSQDPYGVEQARGTLVRAYPVIESELAGDGWAVGDMFTLADCSAFPALFYANKVEPFAGRHPKLARYLERLHARPSIARTFDEARPYMPMFPFYKPEEDA